MLSLHWLRERDVFIKLKVLEANGDLWLVIPKGILRRLRVLEGDRLRLIENPGGGYLIVGSSKDLKKR